MQIHIARHSVQLGVFAPEDVVAGLSSGRFHAPDLAWRDGMQTWTPLGDWPEFRGSGVPSSPGAPAAAAPAASVVPWEQGKSLGSFFATIKAVVAGPSSFASGQFAFGDWLTFCYIGVLLSMPFQLCSALVFGDKTRRSPSCSGACTTRSWISSRSSSPGRAGSRRARRFSAS
jgi:hypothetical protein